MNSPTYTHHPVLKAPQRTPCLVYVDGKPTTYAAYDSPLGGILEILRSIDRDDFSFEQIGRASSHRATLSVAFADGEEKKIEVRRVRGGEAC